MPARHDEGVSRENEIAVLIAERACQRLIYQYARLVDSGQAAQVADLFTEDGVWTGADGRSMQGRAEILAAFSGRQALSRRKSRHVMTNVQIDTDGDHTATGIAYLINYRHDTTGPPDDGPGPARHPKFVGDYHLRFRRDNDQWRIEALRFDLAFLRRHEETAVGPHTG
jgi:uncharacterized protein (TIGR02246 family)